MIQGFIFEKGNEPKKNYWLNKQIFLVTNTLIMHFRKRLRYGFLKIKSKTILGLKKIIDLLVD